MARVNLKIGGQEVNSLDDIKTAFTIAEVFEYFKAGTLQAWLSQHDFNDTAEKIISINKDASNQSIIFKLMSIFELSDEQMDIAYKEEEKRLAYKQKEHDAEIIKEIEEKGKKKEVFISKENLELFIEETFFDLPQQISFSYCFPPISISERLLEINDRCFLLSDRSLFVSYNGLNWEEIKDVSDCAEYEEYERIKYSSGKIFLLHSKDLSDHGDFVASNAIFSAWKKYCCKSDKCVWDITHKGDEPYYLFERKCKGEHIKGEHYPLTSSKQLDKIDYFKGKYVAVGRWCGTGDDDAKKLNYTIYNSDDGKNFVPVTPEEAESQKVQIVQQFCFEDIIFVSAYSKLEESGSEKLFYSINGSKWLQSSIFAHKIVKTNLCYVAFSYECGMGDTTMYLKNYFSLQTKKETEMEVKDKAFIRHIYVSPDGIDWKELPVPEPWLRDIIYCNNKFLFCCEKSQQYDKTDVDHPLCFYATFEDKTKTEKSFYTNSNSKIFPVTRSMLRTKFGKPLNGPLALRVVKRSTVVGANQPLVTCQMSIGGKLFGDEFSASLPFDVEIMRPGVLDSDKDNDIVAFVKRIDTKETSSETPSDDLTKQASDGKMPCDNKKKTLLSRIKNFFN